MRVATGILVAFLLLASASSVAAQGCVMCKVTAAATGEEGAKTLDRAIYLLMVPALLIFVGTLVVAFRYRNPPEEEINKSTIVDGVSPPDKPAYLLPRHRHFTGDRLNGRR